MTENAVEVRSLCKSFGSVKSNQNVSLELKKGEILALLGENGSGKSTFVNMLSGIYRPDSGKILIYGNEVEFYSPEDAIQAGIGMVHQHVKLVKVMTALENITLGEKQAGFFVNKKKIQKKIEEIEEKYGFKIPLNKRVYEMSISEMQTVEIIKMLYHGAKIVILDEPTAVLTPQETKMLFDVLRRMKEAGCSIIIITHKLNEVMEISDRVTVLQKGKVSGTVKTSETFQEELAGMMIGGKVSIDFEYVKAPRSEKPVLEVKNLTAMGKLDGILLDNLSFDSYGGEILGVAGIVGSGQKELCEVLTGLYAASGSALFEGHELLHMNPREIKKLGIRMNFVPEDRLGMGLVGGMDLTNNIILRSYDSQPGFFIDRKAGDKIAKEIVSRYGVSTPSIHQSVRKLSGGNIQKILVAREIEMNPKFLIVSYPFRGLDIGSTRNIIAILNEQKKKGVAILLIAEDLDQLCSISDRIMVLHDGRNMGIVDPREVSKEKIGIMMMGKEA